MTQFTFEFCVLLGFIFFLGLFVKYVTRLWDLERKVKNLHDRLDDMQFSRDRQDQMDRLSLDRRLSALRSMVQSPPGVQELRESTESLHLLLRDLQGQVHQLALDSGLALQQVNKLSPVVEETVLEVDALRNLTEAHDHLLKGTNP